MLTSCPVPRTESDQTHGLRVFLSSYFRWHCESQCGVRTNRRRESCHGSGESGVTQGSCRGRDAGDLASNQRDTRCGGGGGATESRHKRRHQLRKQQSQSRRGVDMDATMRFNRARNRARMTSECGRSRRARPEGIGFLRNSEAVATEKA